ncbi:MAG: hypothetical protein IT428_03070 [Planctomycetaceae bacterium]|nr:hypothetical protein [Planctomycetaceae bacterium]
MPATDTSVATPANLETSSLTYEQRLSRDEDWAMTDAGRFFDERGSVHQTLREISSRLEQLGIPYAVCGGMALFHYGFRRFTEDVVLLVTSEGLRKIHDELEGRGFLPPFAGSKNLRDTATGVRVEFLVAGQFPGDGRPKPVAFPDPSQAASPGNIRYLTLPALVELKLASGMTSPARMKDLADVQELIRQLQLPVAYSEQLNPYVQEKYAELWMNTLGHSKRFVRPISVSFKVLPEESWDAIVARLRANSDEVDRAVADGIQVEADEARGPGHFHLVTTDPQLAEAHSLHDESEFLQP